MTKQLRLPPNQVFPPAYLPLPTPVQWPHHRIGMGATRPVIPFSKHNYKGNGHRIMSTYECSCGANPLNNPHNLAVLAGAYTPITAKLHPPLDDDQIFGPLDVMTNLRFRSLHIDLESPYLPPLRGHEMRHFHTHLFELLPTRLQKLLSTPGLDNLQWVTYTNPESRLAPLLEEHFPGNYRDQEGLRRRTDTQDDGYAADQYDSQEWEGWNLIHREDQVLMGPHPYIRSRYEQAMHDKTVHAAPPGKSLGSYHPALPVMHSPSHESPYHGSVVIRSMPDSGSTCRCGAPTRAQTHIEHVYHAFVGRTICRALEIHTMPWQESQIGASHLRDQMPREYKNKAIQLWRIMEGEWDG